MQLQNLHNSSSAGRQCSVAHGAAVTPAGSTQVQPALINTPQFFVRAASAVPTPAMHPLPSALAGVACSALTMPVSLHAAARLLLLQAAAVKHTLLEGACAPVEATWLLPVQMVVEHALQGCRQAEVSRGHEEPALQLAMAVLQLHEACAKVRGQLLALLHCSCHASSLCCCIIDSPSMSTVAVQVPLSTDVPAVGCNHGAYKPAPAAPAAASSVH